MSSKFRLAYFPQLDALRAFSLIFVIFFHMNPKWLPGGFSCVDIFFVISGFIVSASVLSASGLSFSKFLSFFYVRRIQRLAAALVVCLFVTSIFSILLVPEVWLSDLNRKTGFFAFFGLSNVILALNGNDYFAASTEFNPFTHTWTLGVEEQFYLLFPLIFMGWLQGGRMRQISVWVLSILTLVSIGTSAWWVQTDKSWAYYLLPSRFWELSAGILLFMAMMHKGIDFSQRVQATPKWYTWGAFFSFVIILVGFVVSSNDTFPFPGALPTVLGSLGVMFFLHGKGNDNWLIRIICAKPIIWVGKASYSIYLYHWPVFVFFRWTIGMEEPWQRVTAVLITLLLGALSYYWIENPIRRLKFKRLKHYQIVLSGLTMVILSAWITDALYPLQKNIALNRVSRDRADWYPSHFRLSKTDQGCDTDGNNLNLATGTIRIFKRVGCDAPITGPRIFAMGDSHTMSYMGLFRAYALQTGSQVSIYNMGGGPYISFQPSRENASSYVMNFTAVTTDVLEQIKEGDVVFLASMRIPRYLAAATVVPDEEAIRHFFSEQAAVDRRIAIQQAIAILKPMVDKGARIVFEAPKPVFKTHPYRCAEAYQSTNPVCRAGQSMPREELEKMRQPILEAFKQIQRALPNVYVWDPFVKLCPPTDNQCHTFQNDRPLFLDGDHLSGYGNRILLPSFEAFMQALPPKTS